MASSSSQMEAGKEMGGGGGFHRYLESECRESFIF